MLTLELYTLLSAVRTLRQVGIWDFWFEIYFSYKCYLFHSGGVLCRIWHAIVKHRKQEDQEPAEDADTPEDNIN